MDVRKALLGLTLSLLLGNGVAVAADFNKGFQAAQSGDYKTALAEWTPLAEQGDADAQFNLGIMYAYGQGVSENHTTAVKWYTKAADQGRVKAQFNLGNMYRIGEGVQKNYKTAVKWYTLAAEQGFSKAQTSLGNMYSGAAGVRKDYVRAYMWHHLSSFTGGATGGTLGSQNRENISKEMTEAQISIAQEMSQRCLASNYTDC